MLVVKNLFRGGLFTYIYMTYSGTISLVEIENETINSFIIHITYSTSLRHIRDGMQKVSRPYINLLRRYEHSFRPYIWSNSSRLGQNRQNLRKKQVNWACHISKSIRYFSTKFSLRVNIIKIKISSNHYKKCLP